MIYKSTKGDIDLTKVKMLYPAGIVNVEGEIAEMSLEWCDMNAEKVNITSYVLVFSFSEPSAEVKEKIILTFKEKDELIECMTEVSQLFDA